MHERHSDLAKARFCPPRGLPTEPKYAPHTQPQPTLATSDATKKAAANSAQPALVGVKAFLEATSQLFVKGGGVKGGGEI